MFRHAALVLLALSLVACGGGGGGSDAKVPTQSTITLFPSASLTLLGASASAGFRVGDTAADDPAYGLLTFDTSVIPAGAQILSADLTVFVTEREGTPNLLVPVLLDHSTWPISKIANVTAYYGSYDSEAFAFLTDPSIKLPGRPNSWERALTDQIQATVDAADTFAAFRFRLAAGPLSNGTPDTYVADVPWSYNGLEYPTQLVVTYLAP